MYMAIYVFKKNNKYKIHVFTDKTKAQRFFNKCKRKGLSVQVIY